MSKLLSILALFLLPGLAQAQIMRVDFVDEKAAKRYKKYTIQIGEKMVFLGEPVPDGGVRLNPDSIGYNKNVDPRLPNGNEFFIFNPKDPGFVPYRIEDGKKVAVKKGKTTLMGTDIERISYYMRTEDIQSLVREYHYRLDRIADLADERDEHEKGSKDWFTTHRLLLLDYERIISWMNEFGFASAAKKLEKAYAKEGKLKVAEAVEAREKRALSSVKKVETPETLIEAANEIMDGEVTYAVQESQHCRLTYYTEALSHERVEGLLLGAERIIEGFRAEFVDPYVDEDFEDNIPDGLFIEWFFSPPGGQVHADFDRKYFGHIANARSLEIAGRTLYRAVQPKSIHSWEWGDSRDPEGIIVHNLGHVLAAIHYNGSVTNMQSQWMEEGLGYYLSFEFYGRNSVTCYEFREDDYVKGTGPEGEKTAMMGLRAIYNSMALERGVRFDKLALRYLSEFEDPDLAKSWSIFDYAAKEMGKDGQIWLRKGAVLSRTRKTFLAEWRKVSEEIFDVQGKDVFKVIDDRWREYASSQQDTSEKAGYRKKRKR